MFTFRQINKIRRRGEFVGKEAKIVSSPPSRASAHDTISRDVEILETTWIQSQAVGIQKSISS